jgi:hypothetical protein
MRQHDKTDRTVFDGTECPYNKHLGDVTCYHCHKRLELCECEPFTDDPKTTEQCRDRTGEVER